MKIIQDFKNRKWYEYLGFILLFGIFMLSIYIYIGRWSNMTELTRYVKSVTDAIMKVVYVAFFSIPIIYADFFIFLLRKKEKIRFGLYVKHFLIVGIPILLSLFVLFFDLKSKVVY